jgi:hypothetical protein
MGGAGYRFNEATENDLCVGRQRIRDCTYAAT